MHFFEWNEYLIIFIRISDKCILNQINQYVSGNDVYRRIPLPLGQ